MSASQIHRLVVGRLWLLHKRQIDLRQSGGSLQSVRSSASLNNVVRALNALGATPMDLMSVAINAKCGMSAGKLEII